jgi:Zn-dependent protease with chaperone function
MKIKVALAVVVTLLFVVLDLAALDDITTGKEPSLFLEYVVLGASLIWAALVAAWWSRRQEEWP